MNVITYHASDSELPQHDVFMPASVQILRNNTGYSRTTRRHTAAAADIHSFFSDICVKTNTHSNKKRTPLFASALHLPHAEAYLLPALLLFGMLYAGMLFPFFRNAAGSYTLGTVSFGAEPAFERAFHAYVFPETDVFQEAEAGGVPDYVSQVTFREYTVKKGETVSGIAARSGLRNFGTLLSVNAIDNARQVSEGQMLRIPSVDGLLYTVKKDETLTGIAAAYNMSVTALLDANDLTESTLMVGQQLFIPGASLSSFELRKALGELFIYPIRGRLTSPFGYRQDPFTGIKSFHSGIDLAAPSGTPVKATLDGKVAETGTNRIFGNYVIITHERGYQSLYGHLQKIHAKRGQYVTQGTVIGLVGSTGRSTGPHLHLSVYKNGKMIDPFSVLK